MEKKKEMIDIIVPIFKRTIHTEKCLERLKAFTQDYNLIIVEKEQSASKNINEGLSRVKSKWFVILDDDIWVTPEWLDILKQFRRDDIGQIQPRVLFPFDKIWSAEIELNPLRNVGKFNINTEDYEYVKEAPLLTGCCGLYNSNILKKGIMQDENYEKSQYNDLDFSLQIKNAGFKLLYCGISDVIHSRFLTAQNLTNAVYFKSKWNNFLGGK